MAKKKVIVQNTHGIHARVALSIVEKARGMPSEVTLYQDDKRADACSILDLMLLGAVQGSEVEIDVQGGDEEKYLSELAQIFSDGGGI